MARIRIASTSGASENTIVFSPAGGHSHNGRNSSLIDSTAYSIYDFSPTFVGTEVNPDRAVRQENNRIAFEDVIKRVVNNSVLAPAGIRLEPGSLNGSLIIANTITANQLAANTITAAEISAGTITANELSSNIVLINNRITSQNWNGTISANGTILSNNIGSAGWAITNTHAVFDSTLIRGSIAANSLVTPNLTISNTGAISSTNFNVTAGGNVTATNANITGTITSGSGTIGGWTIDTARIYGGSTYLYSNGSIAIGATTIAANGQITNGGYTLSNTGALTATGANITGSINAGSSITLGSPVNFSVNSAGDILAKTGKIGPVNITTSSMNSANSSPYLNASTNYYNFDNFGDVYVYSNPGSDVGGPHVNQFHSTALVGEYIQIKKTSTSAFSDNLYEARIGDTSGTYAEVVVQNASTSSYVAMYSTGNVSLTGSLNGYSFTSGRHNGANQMVHTDGNGYLQVGYINSSNGNEGNNSNPPRVWGTNGSDDYLRSYLTSALSVASATTAGRLVSTTNNSIDTTGLYPSSVVEPLSIKQNDSSGQNTISYRNEGNTLLMYVTDLGNVRGTGGYVDLSDRASKENIVYVDKSVLSAAVDFLKPATFNYIGKAEQHLGFIAQDVQEFLPDAVKQFDENRLGLDTKVIIAALVAKCQQLEARVRALEGV